MILAAVFFPSLGTWAKTSRLFSLTAFTASSTVKKEITEKAVFAPTPGTERRLKKN